MLGVLPARDAGAGAGSTCCDRDGVRMCPLVGASGKASGDVPEECVCQCWQCQTHCRFEAVERKRVRQLRQGLDDGFRDCTSPVMAQLGTSRSLSAPPNLDLDFALRLHRLRLIRRFVAAPLTSPSMVANSSDHIQRWDFWTDLVHSAILVDETQWRAALKYDEARQYPWYLPAPRGFDVTAGTSVEDRIAGAKRAATEVLGSSACSLNVEASSLGPRGPKGGEWNRLVWWPNVRTRELWPASIARPNRPRQQQGRLRRELEPKIWVRVDVRRMKPQPWRLASDLPSIWERETLVRCRRANDKVELCKNGPPEPVGIEQGDVRNLIARWGVSPLLSSHSLMLLPPLSFFPRDGRRQVPRQLGMEPLLHAGDGGLALPQSLMALGEAGRCDSCARVRDEPQGPEAHWRYLEEDWLRARRVTLMLGGCEDR